MITRFFLFAVGVLLSCSMADFAGLVDSYFPLSDGDRKIFTVPGATIPVLTNTVESVDGSEFTMSSATSGANPDEIIHFRKDNGVIYFLEVDDPSMHSYLTFDSPVYYLDENLLSKGGTHRTTTTANGGLASVTVTVTVANAGSIKVAAGTYANCKKLTVDTEGHSDNPNVGIFGSVTVSILAPGIGLIESGTIYNGSTIYTLQLLTSNTKELTVPTVAIKTPASNAHFSADRISLNGTANDNVGIDFVDFSVNRGSFQRASGSNVWTATNVLLQAGINTIQARAQDLSGNLSAVQTVTVYYDKPTPVAFTLVGKGTVTPATDWATLIAGKTYSVTAKPDAGFSFAGWTVNGTKVTTPTLKFTNTVGLQIVATFVDTTRPEVTVNSPKNNDKLGTNFVTVAGTAKDNDKVTAVFVQVNSDVAKQATGSTNWTFNAGPLAPGTNMIRVFAVDNSGEGSATRFSKTKSVMVKYTLGAPFLVQIDGGGKVAPDLSGKLLDVGTSYTVTATANPGNRFTSWTGGLTNMANKLTFTMTTNGLSLVAHFKESTPPNLTIVSPKANDKVGSELTMTGTASDNALISIVFYRVDGSAWASATQTGANWSKWSAAIHNLALGSHKLEAYACDEAGNYSKTNSVTVSNPSYQGIYMGIYSSTVGPKENGLVTVLVGKDNSAIFMGGGVDFDFGSSFTLATSISFDGAFSVLQGNTTITGKVSAAGITGSYSSPAHDTEAASGGNFTLSKKPADGAQKDNAGFFTGTFTRTAIDIPPQLALVDAVVSADGQFIFNVSKEAESFVERKGAGKGTISLSSAITATMDSPAVNLTGTLNSTGKTITLHANTGIEQFTLNLTRVFTVNDAGLTFGESGLR